MCQTVIDSLSWCPYYGAFCKADSCCSFVGWRSVMSHRVTFVVLVFPIVSVCLFAQGVQMQITPASLPLGQQGNMYGEAFNAAGGTAPYTWSVSTGTLPPGITMNGNGNFVGIPTAAGSFNFAVSATDANGNTTTGNFSVNIAAASGYDGPALLPVATVTSSMAQTPAPGSVINVNAGDDFKAALSSAQCGDTIQLQAGASFM